MRSTHARRPLNASQEMPFIASSGRFVPVRSVIIVLGLAFIGLLASGCGMVISPPTPIPDDPSVAFTAAAETIVAQLTELSGTLMSPEFTSTLVPPSPTPPPRQATQTEEAPTPTQAEETLAPTEASTPTPEPTPSLTPTATRTSLSDADPKSGLGEPDFRDTFQDAANWPLYADENVRFVVQDGALVLTAFNPVQWDGWMVANRSIRDFYIEMTGAFQTCSGLDRYGLFLRASRPESGFVGYLLGISCDGHYSLRRWDGSAFISLTDWTPSEFLKSGATQTNRIGMLARGDKLSIYANGQLLEEIQDGVYQEGRFGFFVGSQNTTNLSVAVEEIAFWELP
jgi:hypothetical protein